MSWGDCVGRFRSYSLCWPPASLYFPSHPSAWSLGPERVDRELSLASQTWRELDAVVGRHRGGSSLNSLSKQEAVGQAWWELRASGLRDSAHICLESLMWAPSQPPGAEQSKWDGWRQLWGPQGGGPRPSWPVYPAFLPSSLWRVACWL